MLPQFTQNFAIPPKSSNDLGKEKFFHLVIRAQLNIQGGENKITISNPIYNTIYVERINRHQNCVLTAIKLFAKTVKYEYYMNEYMTLSVLTAIIHLVTVVIIDKSKENSK